MKEIKLECQGLPCPQPVLKCKSCIEESSPQSFSIIVDNQAAKENVSRFLDSQNYKVSLVTENNGYFELLAEHKKQSSSNSNASASELREEGAKQISASENKQLVFITSDQIGHGDDQLGTKLMHNFIATLPEMGEELWRILFLNSGVKLAIQGSPVLETLKSMERSGVSILVCGTCLDFFNLLEKKAVGVTTNMLDVVTSLQFADKVIRV